MKKIYLSILVVLWTITITAMDDIKKEWFQALNHNNIDSIKKLLETHPNLLTEKDKLGRTAFDHTQLSTEIQNYLIAQRKAQKQTLEPKDVSPENISRSSLPQEYKLVSQSGDTTIPESIKNGLTSDYVRYKTERILTEQPSNTEALNQFMQTRNTFGKITGNHREPLLSILLTEKLYDLANTFLQNGLVDSNFATPDGFNTLYFVLFADANHDTLTITQENLTKVLIDHGATWDSWKDVDNTFIKKFIRPAIGKSGIKQLLEKPSVTKKLFFGDNGQPVSQDKARFFKPSTPEGTTLTTLAQTLGNLAQNK